MVSKFSRGGTWCHGHQGGLGENEPQGMACGGTPVGCYRPCDQRTIGKLEKSADEVSVCKMGGEDAKRDGCLVNASISQIFLRLFLAKKLPPLGQGQGAY